MVLPSGEKASPLETRRSVDLALDIALAVDPVERAERLALGQAAIVHRADPEGAVGPDLAVVEPGLLAGLGLDRGEPAEAAVVGIEDADLVAERHHQPALVGHAERADLARKIPLALGAVGEIDAMNGAADDVAIPERVAPVVIDRPLPEGTTFAAHRLEFQIHRYAPFPSSICPGERPPQAARAPSSRHINCSRAHARLLCRRPVTLFTKSVIRNGRVV